MIKSRFRFAVAVVVGAFFAVVTMAGDAEAQMRTRKGEYYEGVQRKPYGHYWIWPPEDIRPIYKPRRDRDVDGGQPPRARKRPIQ